MANVLVAQLLYLANDDPDKDITLYINSPGGSVSAGMAIYDAMQVCVCVCVTRVWMHKYVRVCCLSAKLCGVDAWAGGVFRGGGAVMARGGLTSADP